MNIYLDTCALNRLTDSQTQPRVRAEAEAVDHILELISDGQFQWVASEALRDELEKNPNEPRRMQTLGLLRHASTELAVTPGVEQRVSKLLKQAFGTYDALHLALCEAASIPCLLTVDDRFIRRAARQTAVPPVEVVNPVDWLSRRMKWRHSP